MQPGGSGSSTAAHPAAELVLACFRSAVAFSIAVAIAIAVALAHQPPDAGSLCSGPGRAGQYKAHSPGSSWHKPPVLPPALLAPVKHPAPDSQRPQAPSPPAHQPTSPPAHQPTSPPATSSLSPSSGSTPTASNRLSRNSRASCSAAVPFTTLGPRWASAAPSLADLRANSTTRLLTAAQKGLRGDQAAGQRGSKGSGQQGGG